MASKQLQRLRNTQIDLANLYHKDQETMASLRRALKMYAGNEPMAKKELQRRISLHQTELFTLRQQMLADAESIKRKAVRTRVASEKSMNDIRWMLDHGSDLHQISQWIISQKRDDGFQALREVISQQAFSQQNTGAGQKRPQDIINEAEKSMEAWEKQLMTPAEIEAVEEAREVSASINYLTRNFDQLDTYFELQLDEQAWRGNVRPVESISKWPGLPGQNLLADGTNIPLESVK